MLNKIFALAVVLLVVWLVFFPGKETHRHRYEDVLRHASPVPQKTSSLTSYFLSHRNEGLAYREGTVFKMPFEFDREKGIVSQSGDFLLTWKMEAQAELTRYDGDAPLETITLPFEYTVHAADWVDGSFYTAGHAEDFLIVTCLDAAGVLIREERLPVSQGVALPTRQKVFSVMREDHWYVWLPSAFEMFVFDTSLELQNRSELEIPDYIRSFDGFIPQALKRESEAGEAAFKILCEKLKGGYFDITPSGLMVKEDRLMLCYYLSELINCHPEHGGVGLKRYSEILEIGQDDFLLQDVQTVDELQVVGYHHLGVIGRRFVGHGKSRYEAVVLD